MNAPDDASFLRTLAALAALAAGTSEDQFVLELRRAGATEPEHTLRNAYRELRRRALEATAVKPPKHQRHPRKPKPTQQPVRQALDLYRTGEPKEELP